MTDHEISVRRQPVGVDRKEKEEQSQMMIQECKLKTSQRSITRREQNHLGHRRQASERRIAVKSDPRAVTTQEAVDGFREKAMRIESVEQIELGNIMELSITGQVFRWARQSNLSGGVSLRKADGWNMKNHSHLTVARHLRENPIVLVVTIREGEEKEYAVQ